MRPLTAALLMLFAALNLPADDAPPIKLTVTIPADGKPVAGELCEVTADTEGKALAWKLSGPAGTLTKSVGRSFLFVPRQTLPGEKVVVRVNTSLNDVLAELEYVVPVGGVDPPKPVPPVPPVPVPPEPGPKPPLPPPDPADTFAARIAAAYRADQLPALQRKALGLELSALYEWAGAKCTDEKVTTAEELVATVYSAAGDLGIKDGDLAPLRAIVRYELKAALARDALFDALGRKRLADVYNRAAAALAAVARSG